MFRGGWNTSASYDNNLETKLLSVFPKVGCTIGSTFIDDCLWVIVKFTRRKDSKQIFKVKKDLKDLNMEHVDLPIGAHRYI